MWLFFWCHSTKASRVLRGVVLIGYVQKTTLNNPQLPLDVYHPAVRHLVFRSASPSRPDSVLRFVGTLPRGQPSSHRKVFGLVSHSHVFRFKGYRYEATEDGNKFRPLLRRNCGDFHV